MVCAPDGVDHSGLGTYVTQHDDSIVRAVVSDAVIAATAETAGHLAAQGESDDADQFQVWWELQVEIEGSAGSAAQIPDELDAHAQHAVVQSAECRLHLPGQQPVRKGGAVENSAQVDPARH